MAGGATMRLEFSGPLSGEKIERFYYFELLENGADISKGIVVVPAVERLAPVCPAA